MLTLTLSPILSLLTMESNYKTAPNMARVLTAHNTKMPKLFPMFSIKALTIYVYPGRKAKLGS